MPQVSDRSGEMIRSLQRGLDVIKCFSHGHDSMTVSEVAQRTDLSRATARRILITLENTGYVSFDGGRYRLRPSVLELGYAYLSSQHPWQAATQVMEQVGARVEENCLAGVLDGQDVVCVARTSHRIVTVGVFVGGRLPAYASSMGRVLLALEQPEILDAYFERARLQKLTDHTLTGEAELREELARVREQGWALVENEVEPGVMGVAVPVYGANGQAVAALNVSAHGGRLDKARAVGTVLPALLDGAAEISMLFGSHPAASSSDS